jgi:hypothetical protein
MKKLTLALLLAFACFWLLGWSVDDDLLSTTDAELYLLEEQMRRQREDLKLEMEIQQDSLRGNGKGNATV